MKSIIVIAIVFIFGFASGTYFGFKEAPIEFENYDSQFKASIYAFENEALQNGRVEKVIESNHILLNGELARYSDHLDSQLFWILKLARNIEPQSTRAIKHAVKYRLDNPFEEPDFSQKGNLNPNVDEAMRQHLIKGQQIHKEKLNRIIQLYTEK